MDTSDDKSSCHPGGLRVLPAAVAALAISLSIFSACAPEEKRYVPNAVNGNVTPTMATTDVTTLISDSGYTRYKITTPLWLMFEDADVPFWKFPEGLMLDQYDYQMQPESNVVCDSAVYFSAKRLWRLDGNVVMVNTLRDSFLTQQLFWDQTQQKIYSDSFIHIVRTDRTIEGYGFESDQRMIEYTVHRPTAILPAERPGSRRQAADSTASSSSDSTARRTVPVRSSSASAPTPAPAAAPEAALAQPADKDRRNEPVKPMKLTPQRK